MHIALRWFPDAVRATDLDDGGTALGTTKLDHAEVSGWVREKEREHPRWVWNDTSSWYPALLADGVRIDRCLDLRLARRILRFAPQRGRHARRDGGPGRLGRGSRAARRGIRRAVRSRCAGSG